MEVASRPIGAAGCGGAELYERAASAVARQRQCERDPVRLVPSCGFEPHEMGARAEPAGRGVGALAEPTVGRR